MISPARVAAYQTGLAVSTEQWTLADALAAGRRTLGDPRDKALAAEIAIGVQRWRATLDHLIAHFCTRPVAKLDREVVEILRLSAFQLIFLTRVPASAVVDDAVNLTGRVGLRSAGGLVNAVLRTLSRNSPRLHLPAAVTDPNTQFGETAPSRTVSDGVTPHVQCVIPVRPADLSGRDAALDYLSIALSHPRWLVERWYTRYGFEATERWLIFNQTPARLTVRANPLLHTRDELVAKFEREGVRVVRGRHAPEALIVQQGQPLADPDVETGWFVVQDEASQLVAHLAGEEPGRSVLDACASPGGKTTALSARMPHDGLLVACDVRPRRVGLLRRTLAACGARNARIVQADLLTPLPFRQAFDCVLVDAPCSGLGTLRRNPDIKWRRSQDDLKGLAASELTMLRHAAAGVRGGGRLIYATCSSEPEENESVVQAFLSATRDFIEVEAARAAPDIASELLDASGHLRTRPDMHALDAFFGAVFERRI